MKETGTVVAFGAHFVGPRHYAPMVVGLDYDYVRSHGAYRQALRNAVLRARALGSKRVLLGMGATFEKTRFGAHVQDRVAFAQAVRPLLLRGARGARRGLTHGVASASS